MDLVILSGTALMCMALGTMSFLIHAEVRDRRRAPYRRAQQPYPGPHGRWRGGMARSSQHAYPPRRPAPAASPHVDPWTPFTVRADTTAAEIKGQYRALARRYHPDHGGDPHMMARINRLYAELLRRDEHAGG
jgi:hypothetical protein